MELVPDQAHAADTTAPYVRMLRKNQDGSYGPPCLWWQERQVKMFLNYKCSADVPPLQCIAAVQKGLFAWNGQRCTDFRFIFMGTTNLSTTGYDKAHPDSNSNLIIWLESGWSASHPLDPNAIAVTTNTYEVRTGRIVDSDIDLNGEIFEFTASDTNINRDIQDVVAHESGHTLGLDHSPLLDSTMYYSADVGEIKKRDLHPTDIQGLCAIYPVGQPSSNCIESVVGGCACNLQPSAHTSTKPWLPFGVLVFLWMTKRCTIRIKPPQLDHPVQKDRAPFR